MNIQVLAPKTVLEALLEWSVDRPLWQRDAMRRIVAVGKLSEADVSELVELCKVDFGAKSERLNAQPLNRTDLPANPGSGAAVALLAISDVVGANNLAPEQTLAFAPQGLTVSSKQHLGQHGLALKLPFWARGARYEMRPAS